MFVPAFDSGRDTVFPFTAQHDRVDVVVKPMYWNLVELRPSEYVYRNIDSLQSPLLRRYYFSDEDKGAAIGSMIGAGVGAVDGFILGLLASVAIGCASGPILCALAFLVALIVAAVVVLAAAFAGGSIGRAAAGSSSPIGSLTCSGVLRRADVLSCGVHVFTRRPPCVSPPTTLRTCSTARRS